MTYTYIIIRQILKFLSDYNQCEKSEKRGVLAILAI